MEPWVPPVPVLVLVVVLVVVLVAVAAWLSWTANRLDRMHHRIDVARETLRVQLLRRSGVTLELALTDALDPASRLVLLDVAHRARNAGPEDFEAAESALSEALRAVLADARGMRVLLDSSGQPVHDPALAPLLGELAQACAKVELARRFHNDVVVSARALRSRRRVRWLHLAGRAGPLRTVDLDDVPPPALQAA
jgi:hypothetical protein